MRLLIIEVRSNHFNTNVDANPTGSSTLLAYRHSAPKESI